MNILTGQRWRYRDFGIIEITAASCNKYEAVIVQVMKNNNWTLNYKWRFVPGMKSYEAAVDFGWVYLEGQDRGK